MNPLPVEPAHPISAVWRFRLQFFKLCCLSYPNLAGFQHCKRDTLLAMKQIGAVGFAVTTLLLPPPSQGDPSAQRIWDSRCDLRIENRVRDDYHLTGEAFANLSLHISRRMIAPKMDYVPRVSVADRAKSI